MHLLRIEFHFLFSQQTANFLQHAAPLSQQFLRMKTCLCPVSFSTCNQKFSKLNKQKKTSSQCDRTKPYTQLPPSPTCSISTRGRRYSTSKDYFYTMSFHFLFFFVKSSLSSSFRRSSRTMGFKLAGLNTDVQLPEWLPSLKTCWLKHCRIAPSNKPVKQAQHYLKKKYCLFLFHLQSKILKFEDIKPNKAVKQRSNRM